MTPEDLVPSSLLFSYGTLQQGERAEYHLAEARYLGEVRTIESFLLVDCGQFPGLVDEPTHASSTRIHGELYQIPDSLWPALDDYEGVHEGDYHRTQIRVTHPELNETSVEAYIWAKQWSHLPVVGATWKTYRRRHYPSE